MAPRKKPESEPEPEDQGQPGELILPEMVRRFVEIEIVGTSSLIMHQWSEKAKRKILDKQTKRATNAQEPKSPEEDFEASLYRLNGGYGFPSVAFKSAAVRAGTYADQKMTFLRGAFHVLNELVPIEGEPKPREDMVRVSSGGADIRYRGEFIDWGAVIPVDLNERAVSVEQLVNLFRIAGFAVGIGDWRPEKNGQHGRWDVKEVTVK